MNSPEWREIRAGMQEKHPFCELHEKRGIKVPATCIHHIREVESGHTEAESTELCYNPDNLIALCERCHKNIHQRKGYNTIAGQKRRAADRASRWINKVCPAAAGSVEATLPSGYSLHEERQRVIDEAAALLPHYPTEGSLSSPQKAVGGLLPISMGTLSVRQEKSPHGANTGLSGKVLHLRKKCYFNPTAGSVEAPLPSGYSRHHERAGYQMGQ